MFNVVISFLLSLEGITSETMSMDYLIDHGHSGTEAYQLSSAYENVLGVFTFRMSIFGGIIIGFWSAFGRHEGRNPDAAVIKIGSHYDVVVNGGAFGGVAGVVAALETLGIFEETNIDNYYLIEIVAMNTEEGETFGSGSGVSNSKAMVGTITEKELDTAKNRFGETKKETMRKYGLIPDLENE